MNVERGDVRFFSDWGGEGFCITVNCMQLPKHPPPQKKTSPEEPPPPSEKTQCHHALLEKLCHAIRYSLFLQKQGPKVEKKRKK